MKRFKHINAHSLEEAIAILKEKGERAKVIAGGTDLLGEVKDDILPESPEVILNLKTISNLDYIREENQHIVIGALTRLEDIARDKLVKKKCSVMAEAALATASPHIRDMGTIGGNICQNNRCWYYWVQDNRFNCLRKGGKECYALTGDGRYHSIFGANRVSAAPCSSGCPNDTTIPAYLSMIREGNILEAARELFSHNPLAAITGRICPHFCEQECNRGVYDESVSMREIERYMGDYILNNADHMYLTPTKETNKRIAVIGSGPAGLSAAYFLRKSGHHVTIFESMKEAGGLLTYGIPPYRLPKDVVIKQIKALENMGIKILLNTKVTKQKMLTDVKNNFDVVFIASGTWKEKATGIKGEQLILSGNVFLRKMNSEIQENPGKRVGVIGGGNVAIDVARSLLRMGSEPVIIYRRTIAEMPALKEEVGKAIQEGIKIEFLTLPVEILKKDNRVILNCTRMELGPLDETGRPRPVPIKGSDFSLEFDAVFSATGEEADTSIIPEEFLDNKGKLKINSDSGYLGGTFFSGGDFVSGPATVVAAIASGRHVAISVDKYLHSGNNTDQIQNHREANSAKRFNSAYLNKTNRVKVRELPLKERVNNLNVEETTTLDLEAVQIEANRCFNCGCVAVNPSDLAPVLIALDAKIKTTKRTVNAEDFFAAGINVTTILDCDEIVESLAIPLPGPDKKAKFIKFALRKAIDFPIVNCAAAIETQKGKVKSARICLNAVYNLPYRVREAEEYLSGKPINEANAEKASNVVVKDAFPLLNNQYKIQIAKALVKRSILACQSEK
jgi:NADPH-dependent glutamate synthase beta subunit-like oxidoreductase/CO/xanthine dehydrogenase FAD-binding subunit